MKKIAIGILAIIIILVMLVLVFSSTGSDKYIDDMNIGSWGQEIILHYEDGSTQPLKAVLEKPFSIWVDSKPIAGMTYKLSAKATGGTKSNVKIDIGDYVYYHKMYQLGENVWQKKIIVSNIVDNIVVKMPIDDNWHELFSVFKSAKDLYDPSLSGKFNYIFEPGGTLRFQVDDGSWEIASLPDNVGFIAEVKKDGSELKVSFKQGHFP